LTSNLGTDTLTQLGESPVRPEPDEVLKAVRPELSQYFKPALLARMTVVPYLTLNEEAINQIVVLKLDKLGRLLKQEQRINLQYGDEVVKAIAERCTEVEEGARNVDHIMAQNLLPIISQKILEVMAEEGRPTVLNLGHDGQGFTFDFV
jgi:type VI secretion system protein VasG